MPEVCVALFRSVCCCLLLLFLSTATAQIIGGSTVEPLTCKESGNGPFISTALNRSYTVRALPTNKEFANLTERLSYVDELICNQGKHRVGLESFAELWYLTACVLCTATTHFGQSLNKTNILTSAYLNVEEPEMKPEDVIKYKIGNGRWKGWNTTVTEGVVRSVALLNPVTGDPLNSTTTVPPGNYTIVLIGSNTQSCSQDDGTYETWGLLSYEAQGEALSWRGHVICEEPYEPLTSTPPSVSYTTSTSHITDPPPTTADPTDFPESTEEPTNEMTDESTTLTIAEPTDATTNGTTTLTTEKTTVTTTESTNLTTKKPTTTTNNTTTVTTTEPEATNLTTGTTDSTLFSTTTTPTTTTTTTTSTTTTPVPDIDCCIIEVDYPLLCPGEDHKERCQEGYDGWVEIQCDKNGTLTRIDNCVAVWINNVGDKVTSGNYSAIDLAAEAKNYTEGEAELTSNDLMELVGVIGNLTFLLDVQVEEFEEGEREGLATNYTSEFVALVGNVISNTGAWDGMSKVKAAELGSSLLGDLEHTGFTLAGQVTRGTIPFSDPDLDLTVYSYPREDIEDESLYFPSPFAPTHILLPPLATLYQPPGTQTDPQVRVVGYLVPRNITGPILPGALNRDVPHPRSKEVNSGVVSLSVGEQGRRVTFRGGRGGGGKAGGSVQGGGGSVEGGRSVEGEGSMSRGEGGGESVIIRLEHAIKEVGPAYKELHRDQRADEKVPSRVPGSATCVYWDLDQSVWAPDGCETINSTREVTYCRCYHLTMFAIITDVHGFVGRDPVLDLLGTCLTCLSCIASFATFFILHTAKSDVSLQRISITKQLCLAIGLSHLSILLLLDRDFLKQSETMCAVSSVLMHYLATAGVCWMLAEGVHLLHTIHTVLSAAQLQPLYWLGGYGVPAVVVMVTLLIAYGTEGWITQEAYAPQGSEYCWLSTEQGYIWAFTGPLVVMIVVNTVIMILALRAAATLRVNRQKSRYQRAMVWVRGSFSLNCVLGVSWVFGLIYMNTVYFFAYLFTIFNASQGVMLLIFNCLLNESVRTAFIARLPARLANCLTKKKEHSSSRTTTRATTTHHHHHHHQRTRHHNHNPLPDNQSHPNNNNHLIGYDNPALSLDDHNYQTIDHSEAYHNDNNYQNYPASNQNYHYSNNNNHGAIIALKRCFDEWMQYDSDSRQRGSNDVVDEGAAARPKKIEEADTTAASRWRVAGNKMGKWWRNEAPTTTNPNNTTTTTTTPNNHSTPTQRHPYRITGVSRSSPGESPQMRRRESRAPSQWSTDTFITYISDSPMMSLRRISLDSSVSSDSATRTTSSTPLSTPPNTVSSPPPPPSSRFSLPASFTLPPQSSFPSRSSLPSQSSFSLPPHPSLPPPSSIPPPFLSPPSPITRRYSLPPSISPSPVRSSLPLSPSPLHPRSSLSTPSSPSPPSYAPLRKISSPLPLPSSLQEMWSRGNSRAVKESIINPPRYPFSQADDLQRYTPEFDTILEYDDERSPKRIGEEIFF